MSAGTFTYDKERYTGTLVINSPTIDSRVVISPKGIAYEAIYSGDIKDSCEQECRGMSEEQVEAFATMLTLNITRSILETMVSMGRVPAEDERNIIG